MTMMDAKQVESWNCLQSRFDSSFRNTFFINNLLLELATTNQGQGTKLINDTMEGKTAGQGITHIADEIRYSH